MDKGLISLFGDILQRQYYDGVKAEVRRCRLVLKAVDILTKCGFTFDDDDIEDHEIIHAAVKIKHSTKIVECLLKLGANPDSILNGRTLLHDAIRSREMVELLIKSKCDVNAKSEDKCPIYYAVMANDEEVVKLLLSNGANTDDGSADIKLLHIAVKNKKVNLCKMLIDHGINVNACDHYGRTALHYAEEKDIVELLIQYGVDINARDKDGRTALHVAVKLQHVDALISLLEYDIDIDAQDSKGDTALHIAADTGDDWPAEELLDKGCDVNITNNRGQTPVDCATTMWSSNRFQRTLNHINDRITKLEVAGLFVSKKNLQQVRATRRYCDKVYRRKCKLELEEIRGIKLDDNTSLYDALIKCNVPRLTGEFMKILEKTDYDKFPKYGRWMKNNLKKYEQQRRKLISSGIDSFCTLNRAKKLPVEIVEKIVCELENHDLKKLISCSESSKDELENPPTKRRCN